MTESLPRRDTPTLTQVRVWARELGFSQIGMTHVDLRHAEPGLLAWLEAHYHGQMHYMSAHGLKRARPAQLVEGTVAVLTARMDYLPQDTPADWLEQEWAHLHDARTAMVSIYARGRDYHKVLRLRLQQLADRINSAVQDDDEATPIAARVFTDSAPVLEVELAHQGHLGWRGKHTLLLSREAGSMFFLGEIFLTRMLMDDSRNSDSTDAATRASSAKPASAPNSPPASPANSSHCGTCSACIDVCPTRAIVAPYRLDARLCISYQTIENPDEIPVVLRPLIGQRIYGCDDCQLICPWNKFAQTSTLPDFATRPDWRPSQDNWQRLFAWDEATFLKHTEGSPIRRIGHTRWLRNLAVAMGNMLKSAVATGDLHVQEVLQSNLRSRLNHESALVRSHVQWALAQGDSQQAPMQLLPPHDFATPKISPQKDENA